ncbi:MULTISPECIES: exodeoxyribonuclease VII large subunit [unclassified Colwellia]|uniref:exodeoxyribonuclease VII large subunit n=1 Tax=unclassified Colwellia TaxID=196834 RepID=UPI0015F4A810|nr:MULTISPECIES: exodeoxyribonuclease VII large subunit [unclassified Colwellia]MBA6233230.1 exodeoxyribonuclease VII large subunit [Colwellia sp. MB02u-7]MBA6236320.1 exodeoxyribonuclease VII large subunit [Colwellia sp. MB02u-11]MBA6256854.1 exodeoxyribonuclease VII large subunit [Colwellia sp. MB3u-28]MBA6261140.1 exodeoxyribonuclease VII large subunit [Colwellia sp. MB3u-41]MBA6298280.1 exodeoxyribonuclease VII large subunit [Colwellia sp. MB3u-22]
MATQHILQVSELTKKVKFMLESELNTVWLCGEISNFIAASSGHWYLSLKDSKSQVRCAMFKGNNRRVRLTGSSTPRNGQQVLVRAKVSLYEPRGDFQLIIEMMEDAGEGILRQQFEQLKSKLNAQGLFGQQFKQKIPRNITTVGVVTSPTGAAVKDIISVLQRRNPTIAVVIYPALVQGKHAKGDIADAIDIANQREECQVLIVGRGGGSLEDLWPFNEEDVVNAIFHSRIPVISAVGHEIDTTLSDLVADLRAPTPSAAAELVSQDNSELQTRLRELSKRAQHLFTQKVKQENLTLQTLIHRLTQVHPERKLQQYQQKSDELNIRLDKVIKHQFERFRQAPEKLARDLQYCDPSKVIIQHQKTLSHLDEKLQRDFHLIVKNKTEHFISVIEQLNIVSPLATIARGYSVSRNSRHQIIRTKDQVSVGDEISIQVNDGSIFTKVISNV